VLPLLAVAPEDRPASAGEVRDALSGIARSIPGVDRAAVRAFMASLMPTSSRPLESSSAGIEAALANVLGVRAGGGRGTERVPSATPAPPGLAHTIAAPLDPQTEIEPVPPGPVRSRRGRLGVAAVVVLGLGVIGAMAAVALTNDGANGTVEPPPASTRAANGFLRLRSNPPGASVEVDGEVWEEETPTVVPTTADVEHRILFRLAGHTAVEQRAAASAGATVNVEATLVPTPGRLDVRSDPPGANVRIDGELRGRTPLVIEDAPRRVLGVEVSLEGHTTHRETAPLDRVDAHVVDAVLERRSATGLLDVSSRPWARVAVGGRVVAESTPAVGIRLPVGSHVVTLENPRLGVSERRRVRIREGRTTQLVVELDSR
jgi:hypothetical protein